MKKFKIIIAFIIILTIFVGCSKQDKENHEIIQKGDKQINIITDRDYTMGEDIIENIDVYEGFKGYDWIDNDRILGIAQNKVNVDFYDLKNMINIKEKNILIENLPYQYINVSPNKEHVFLVDQVAEAAYFMDLNGDIKAKYKGPYASELGLAMWFNSQGLIMPYRNRGFYMLEMNKGEIKIEDVEKEGSIDKVVRIDNKIYYTIQTKSEKKMKVYDMDLKESKIFIDDRILDFHLLPTKNQFILEVQDSNHEKMNILISDLDGIDKALIAEGRMIYGLSCSPDGSKFVYIVNSRGQNDEGLFIIDIKESKKTQLSTGYLDLESDIKWSPMGNKIMINNSEIKDGKWIDKTNIIKFK